METVFSNGPSLDFVINPFTALLSESTNVYIAAPYVTETTELLEAANQGKQILLLAGLNSITNPDALSKIHGKPNIQIRFYAKRFHAKIYVFDCAALLGSSNLTLPGLRFNREATIRLDDPQDNERINEVRSLFWELWNPAPTLTTEKLNEFASAYKRFVHSDIDGLIGQAVGNAEPPNVNVASQKAQGSRIFLEQLRRQVYAYRTAFNEVTKLLQDNHLQRAELLNLGAEHETNRFLNWVRLTCAQGEDSWKEAPLRPDQKGRHEEILRLGREWTHSEKHKIPESYIDWLRRVQDLFSSPESIEMASKEDLTDALMSIHAFNEQLRYVKGGEKNLGAAFWRENNDGVARAKSTFRFLLFGGGEFIDRLHDILYEPTRKVKSFGLSCSLELFGTIKPNEYPPVNFRIAKGLRFLGYDVIAE